MAHDARGRRIVDAFKSDLDRLMAQLRAQPSDSALHSLEPRVWRRIASGAARGNVTGQLQWRAAAVGLALSLGAVFGGFAPGSGAPTEMAVFSAYATLAPSTILEGGE
jgi:hypothetical protein